MKQRNRTFLKFLTGMSMLLLSPNIMAVRYIFQWPTTQAGDNLVSLYNAYAYARKYSLTLAVAPFNHIELFNCYHLLPQLPLAIFNSRHDRRKVIEITTERDIVKHLHNPHVHFCVHVHTQRIPIRPINTVGAKQLVNLNEHINLDYLKDLQKKEPNVFTIAVHIRKGNGGGQIYDGQLWSEQIFDFDRSLVRYTKDTTYNPFNFFEAEEKFACTRDQFPAMDSPDISWTTKFPPEQYYIDQINLLAANTSDTVVVRVFTDDKDPLALIDRLKANCTNDRIRFEYHDNRDKGYKKMMVEDLYLMSQCDALIRSTSRFAIIAEVLGNYKTVILPTKGTWLNNKKLIISDIVIREYR
jgi:hypothetical protein